MNVYNRFFIMLDNKTTGIIKTEKCNTGQLVSIEEWIKKKPTQQIPLKWRFCRKWEYAIPVY